MKDEPTLVSPCISICELSLKTGLCKGCWRSSDEIKSWQHCNDSDRLKILRNCRQRKIEKGYSFRRQSKRKILSKINK